MVKRGLTKLKHNITENLFIKEGLRTIKEGLRTIKEGLRTIKEWLSKDY